MQKFLKKSTYFLLFGLIIYPCFVIIWAESFSFFGFGQKVIYYPIAGKGFSFSRLKEVKSSGHIDWLFLGSSHAYRGFDPSIFAERGYTSFNLGSPSQTPIQTKFLVNQYLEQLNPKTVIYEVYPATFMNNGVESAVDMLANEVFDWGLVKMAIHINDNSLYNTLIYDSYRELLDLNEEVKEDSIKKNDVYTAHGFVKSSIYENKKPITEAIQRKWLNKRWTLREEQLEAFEEVLDSLDKKDVNYWLVQMPVTKKAYKLYSNNTSVDSIFHSYGKYVNLNEKMSLDDHKDFIDYHHLSQTGVEKTNTFLLQYLSER